MAHGLIEGEDSMASGKGIMPWHKLGEVMPERNMTSREALELAKMDWLVTKQPLQAVVKNEVGQSYNVPVPQNWALVREDTKRVLGVVGDNYRPVQNVEAFSFLDDLLMDPNGAYIETAGSLHGGTVVWIMVALADTISVGGKDNINSYMLLTNRNTGKRSLELSHVNVRVVCANTLSWAENSQNDLLKIRHIAKLADSVDKAREMFKIAKDNNNRMSEVFNRMTDAYATPDRIDAVLADLLPGNPNSDNASAIARTNTFRDRIKYLSVKGAGNEEFAGSWWGVYNGITEWSDHHKQVARGAATKASTMTQDEVRLQSNWSGPSASFKAAALDRIVAEISVDFKPITSSNRELPQFDDKNSKALAKALGYNSSSDEPKEELVTIPKDATQLLDFVNLDCDTSDNRRRELVALVNQMYFDLGKNKKSFTAPSYMDKGEFSRLLKEVKSNYHLMTSWKEDLVPA